MVTKEQFQTYETIRLSGATNMFDVKQVMRLAKCYFETKLSKENITEIMKNYKELKKEHESN